MNQAEKSPRRIQTRIEGRKAWVTLNRPPLNVLNIETLRAMGQAVNEMILHSDILVFQAKGRAFSRGCRGKGPCTR